MLSPSMISIFRRLSNYLENHGLPSNWSISSAKTLFDGLDKHPIWGLRQAIGDSIAHTLGVSSSFISFQVSTDRIHYLNHPPLATY
jgi:hypothetical protein